MQETKRDWVKFTTNGGSGYMRVSIDKRGRILLNSFLMEQIGDAGGVSLFYDRETKSIGLLPLNDLDDDPDSLRLNKFTGRQYGSVYAVAFIRRYGIAIDKTLATHNIDTEPNGMLIVDLRHAYVVERKKREARQIL